MKLPTITYQSIRHHYGEVLSLITFFITKLADEAIEIVARAVMLAAPLPNAVSVFAITQRTQGFNLLQATAFALTIEIVIFFLIEVALLMLTRWLQGKSVYKWAFIGMCIVVVVVAAIVIRLVYVLDDYKVMAWMPVLSICAFIGIGLKRWDATMAQKVKQVKVIQDESKRESVSQKVNQLDADDLILLNHYRTHPLDSEREAARATGLNQSKVNRRLKRFAESKVIHRNGNGVEVLEG